MNVTTFESVKEKILYEFMFEINILLTKFYSSNQIYAISFRILFKSTNIFIEIRGVAGSQ